MPAELLKKGLLIIVLAVLLLPGRQDVLAAATAKDLYFSADRSYKLLRHSPRKQKYRENWFNCIKKYQAVYRFNPKGPWAAAGLYQAGVLYGELYKRSYKAADKREALDIFRRIANRFPESVYKKKALAAIKGFSAKASTRTKTPETSARKKPAVKPSPRGREKYTAAETAYQQLRGQPKKMKYRHNWLACIEKFKAAHAVDAKGPYAAASLYMAGRLYTELYARSYKTDDKQAALAFFDRIASGYTDSAYHPKAVAARAELSPDSLPKKSVEEKEPASSSLPPVDKVAGLIQTSQGQNYQKTAHRPSSDPNHSTVTGIRFWSNPSYTRVVIDADQEAGFTHRLLKKDPSLKKPQRLYIDLEQSRMGAGLRTFLPINDNLLTDTRAGQYTADAVRVVVDIKSFKTYKIFSLKNPFRIVIDVWGQDQPAAQARKEAVKTPKTSTPLSPSALAKQLALGVRRIVIDPGHGGRDFGAPGYLKGVHEKDIVLKIAKRLAAKMRKKLNCEVFMTRSTDKFLTLEERTAIANTKNADLFISIHTNSARDRRAYGIETYFLNLATDDEAIMVAARENATSTKNISDLQSILNDLMQNAKINESSRLAGHVQDSLCTCLKKHYKPIRDKGGEAGAVLRAAGRPDAGNTD